ncbi:hypothetical protein BN1013_02135 [Candidatus Rubidus massiliensis]|nr:hypothetical protein BN1013_02135 [Candidatus Rubidus massiliensis]
MVNSISFSSNFSSDNIKKEIPPQVTIALESGKTATIGLTHFLDHEQIIKQYLSQKNKMEPLNIKVKLTPFSLNIYKTMSKFVDTSITYATEISKEGKEFRVIDIEF